MQSIDSFVNLDRYPLHDLSSSQRQTLLESCRNQFQEEGVCVLPEFLCTTGLQNLIQESLGISHKAFHQTVKGNAYLEEIPTDLPDDHPMRFEDTTALGVIAQDLIPQESGLQILYQWQPFIDFIAGVIGRGPLFPYACPLGGINLAVMNEGDHLRWHFDQSDFVVSVNLQDPQAGGKFEYVRNIRSADDPRYEAVSALLKGSREKVEILDNPPGCLVLFEGRHTIHRVTQIEGHQSRLIALFGYGLTPHVTSSDYLRQIRYGRTL